MDRKVGLWIDHRKAVIVILTAEGQETREIDSSMEKHVRFAGGSHADGSQSAEDVRDRGFANHLGKYYDDVIACIRDAESIQIFGPGEAKGELEKRLANQGFGGRVVGIETVDKMTDRQIAAKVRQHFE
ncbi:MAG: hypothetical protein WCF84_06210 [Anaerolineae bacterium]